MILPFSKKFPWGKETNFDLKIAKSFIENGLGDKSHFIDIPNNINPKLHTIRSDKNNRWAPGKMIHMYYNSRKKDMRLIAPPVPCVSTQKIEIRWYYPQNLKKVANIFIDKRSFACIIWNKGFDDQPIITGKMEQIANNDGFDTIEDFFRWFNKDFTGKIIHWTNLRY